MSLKPCAFLLCLLIAFPVLAENSRIITATSPPYRVALLELYTSEGCSSCPPADRWLSSLKDSAITGRQVVPLAFHVTYWDYIGWKDRFASPQHDQRQRRLAALAHSRTVYTPQFMLNGRDFRRARNLDSDIRKINDGPAALDLHLTVAEAQPDVLDVGVDVDGAMRSSTAIYIVLYENGLSSDVNDGENEGEHLRHDYVVRRIYSPQPRSSTDNKTTVRQSIPLENDWRRENMGIVAFAQDMDSGEVLQAVSVQMAARALAAVAE